MLHPFTLLLIALYFPCAQGAISDSTIDELIVVTGLDSYAESLPKMMMDVADQIIEQNGPPEDTQVPLREMFAETVQSDAILTNIKRNLKNRYSESEAQEKINWWRSSLGQKIDAAEDAASTPAARREIVRRAQALMMSEQRMELAMEIASLSGNPERMVDFQDKTFRLIFAEVQRRAGRDRDTTELDEFMESSRATRLANLNQMRYVSYIYAYKKFDIRTIERYITELRRQSFLNFNEIVEDAIFEEFDAALVKITKALGDEYEEKYLSE